MNQKIKINYFGLIKSVMSWANVARELLLALDTLGCDVSITNCRGHLYNSGLKIDKRLLGLMEKGRNADFEICFDYPLNYGRLTGKTKIGLLVYESTILPQAWIDNIKKHLDLLIVPSRFCEKIMIDNGIPKEMVKLVPYGYDPRKFIPATKHKFFKTEKDFVFLTIAMPHKRKGLDILIEAFAEEFSSKDNAALVIKTPYLPFRNKKFWEMDIQELLDKNIKSKNGYPEISLIVKEEDPDTLPGYYAGCDCYVQPSRSEGFGLSVLEAMAMKRPVITTGWGGQTGFCGADNSFLIRYSIIDAGEAQYDKMSPGSKIAYPDKNHLRELMRFVYENRDEANRIAEKGYQDTRHLTWENSAKMLIDVMKKIGVSAIEE